LSVCRFHEDQFLTAEAEADNNIWSFPVSITISLAGNTASTFTLKNDSLLLLLLLFIIFITEGGVAHAVQRLATGWTVEGSEFESR
jgi:hypothetical protein